MDTQQAFLNHIDLTTEEKASLSSLLHTRPYNALLKLMHGEVVKAETEHYKAYRDPVLFDRLGQIAVAMRLFMERIETEVQHQVSEVLEKQKQDAVAAKMAEVKNPTFGSIAEAISLSPRI
jgi:hypothetical protein